MASWRVRAGATNDSDQLGQTGTLTFAPGATTKTITIEVKGDDKKEADETFYLDLFGNPPLADPPLADCSPRTGAPAQS